MTFNLRFIAEILVSSVAAIAAADERIVYRSVMPNGQIVYADRPDANAKRSERLTIERHAVSPQQEQASQRALALSRAQLLRDADARVARLKQLDNAGIDAYEVLRQAQEQLASGREPVEGERQGRRLLPSYWQRQRQLQASVRLAQDRLDAILGERASLQ